VIPALDRIVAIKVLCSSADRAELRERLSAKQRRSPAPEPIRTSAPRSDTGHHDATDIVGWNIWQDDGRSATSRRSTALTGRFRWSGIAVCDADFTTRSTKAHTEKA